MITDPIADLFTRIRNGYMARLQEVSAPYSKILERIAKILVKNRYVAGCETVADGNIKTLKVALNDVRKTKYVPTLARISKPGRRVDVRLQLQHLVQGVHAQPRHFVEACFHISIKSGAGGKQA